jgi:hypothetical protein
MKKILVVLAASLLSACVIVFPFEAQSKGSVNIGYKVEDSVGKNINGHQKWTKEFDQWQFETETNYYYTTIDGEEKTNRGDGEYEVILNLSEKHYAINNFGFNYNKFRDTQALRPHMGIGWGWKFFRNDRWKMSNELTLTQMGKEGYSEMVYRNSLWLRYKHPESKWTFTNKYLFENGSDVHKLTKNELIISYKLTENTNFSVRDLYITDDAEEEYSVTYMTLGYKF